MDEDKVTCQAAAGSTIAARSDGKQPEDGTERLKPYRWQKGQSGNREGRRAELRMTGALRAMSMMPLPEVVRKRLEAGIGGSLPDDLTFADGYGIAQWLAMFGINVGFRLDIGIDTRHATDDTETQKVEVIQPVERDGDALRRHIREKLIETAYKRSKLYNMEIPALTRMAAEAGVDLDEAMGDKKPSSPEAGIRDKEPRRSAETHSDSPPKFP